MLVGEQREASAYFHLPAIDAAVQMVNNAFLTEEVSLGVAFTKIEFEVILADDADSSTLRILVGRARVVSISRPSSFVHDLDRADRDMLRALTRRLHEKQCGEWSRPLTDAEIDGVIEEAGAEVAEEMLREEVREKTL